MRRTLGNTTGRANIIRYGIHTSVGGERKKRSTPHAAAIPTHTDAHMCMCAQAQVHAHTGVGQSRFIFVCMEKDTQVAWLNYQTSLLKR